MDFFNVNWLAVFLAALSGFVVGGIWYGPIMGKKWLGAVGLTEEDVQGANMGLIYGTTFFLSLVAAFVLAHTIETYGDLSFSTIVMIAQGVAAGFIIPAIGTNYLFSQKSRTLFLIDAGYWLLFYTAMGTVMAYFYAG